LLPLGRFIHLKNNKKLYSTTNNIFDATVARNSKINVSLNNLRDNPGAKQQRTRWGRGAGSGKGKTAGRGGKGQTARSGGGVRFGFEGGQTPAYRRYRKYGFTNAAHKRQYAIVNLDKLQLWIDSGRIDPSQKITMKTFVDSGLVTKLRKKQLGMKLLGIGASSFAAKVTLEVSQASTQAIKAIEKQGGSVRLVYYDRQGLRSLLYPEKFQLKPYLRVPPLRYNRKLRRPMEQPDQHPEWLATRESLAKAKVDESKVEEL